MLRLATQYDFDHIVRMTRRFHQESPYSSIPYSEKKVTDLFNLYLADKTRIIIILSEQDDKPRGMIVGLCDSPPFSDIKVTTELAWWMDHEYRKSRDSLLLMKAYEDWGRRVGANISQMAYLSTSPDLSSFYERSGYNLVEQTYIKELS